MKVLEVLTRLENVRAHAFNQATLIGWLSELEGRLYHDVVAWHVGAEDVPHGPYVPDALEAELMVPDIYAGLYLYYLEAMMAYYEADYTKYNNCMMMYNQQLKAYAAWYNRTHAPKQSHAIRI